MTVESNKTEKDENIGHTIIHAEGEIGSAIFDLTIENANAVQLFGIAKIIEAQAMVTLAANQVAEADRHRSGIVLPPVALLS